MTDMLKTEVEVLKTDEAGRVRTPAARREHLLNEFDRSGWSGQKFAELAGIKYPTFAGWARQRRLRRQGAASEVKSVDSVQWLEAVVEQAQADGVPARPISLVLQLPGGARVELADEKQMALTAVLIRALAKSC
jgi:hypothetical protein